MLTQIRLPKKIMTGQFIGDHPKFWNMSYCPQSDQHGSQHHNWVAVGINGPLVLLTSWRLAIQLEVHAKAASWCVPNPQQKWPVSRNTMTSRGHSFWDTPKFLFKSGCNKENTYQHAAKLPASPRTENAGRMPTFCGDSKRPLLLAFAWWLCEVRLIKIDWALCRLLVVGCFAPNTSKRIPV